MKRVFARRLRGVFQPRKTGVRGSMDLELPLLGGVEMQPTFDALESSLQRRGGSPYRSVIMPELCLVIWSALAPAAK